MPPGYGAAWSVLGAGGLALLAAMGLRASDHRAGGPPPAPSASVPAVHLPRPAAAPTATPVQDVSAPAPGPAAAPGASEPVPSRSGAGGTPAPRPSPAGAGLVGASLVVPLRGSTPLAVRVAVAVPAGPPLLPTLDLAAVLPLRR